MHICISLRFLNNAFQLAHTICMSCISLHYINKVEVPYYLFGTGMVKNPDCIGKCNFLKAPYYKFVLEIVKLISKALARSHFLIKEGVP